MLFFLNMKGPITIEFIDKEAATHSASYCQRVRQNSPYLLNALVELFEKQIGLKLIF